MPVTIGRRELLSALGGAAVSWPIAARAAGPRPRIAVLSINSEQDERKNVVAFVDGLRALGYVTSQNVDIDYVFGGAKTARDHSGALVRQYVPLLVAAEIDWRLVLHRQRRIRAAPGLPLIIMSR
jgi:putative tryptophan/tyrosine transport system substrate-binding protein